MADITVSDVTRGGMTPSLAAVSSSDQFANPSTERTFLRVSNAGGGALTVTVPAQTSTVEVPGIGTVDIDDIVVSVPAGEERWIGPFPSAYTASDGKTTVNYSSTASVTAQAIKIPVDSV